MDFSQTGNANGLSYSDTAADKTTSDNTKHDPPTDYDYKNDAEFSVLLKKYKKRSLKNKQIRIWLPILIVIELIIFAIGFVLRTGMYQPIIFGSLGITVECVYFGVFFSGFCSGLDSDDLSKISKDMQDHFKNLDKPLSKKQAAKVLKPYVICIVLGIIFFIVGTAGFIIIIIKSMDTASSLNVGDYFTSVRTLHAVFYAILHFLSGLGLLLTSYGATATKGLTEYRCKCGCMFSFTSRRDYDYKSETRRHEASYKNRDVAAGSVYSNGQKIGTIYKTESYQTAPASEWRHTYESWEDICCVCGKHKKRSRSDMFKIRDL